MDKIEIPGVLAAGLMPGGHVLSILPLTLGRFRVTIARPRFDGGPNVDTYDDGY